MIRGQTSIEFLILLGFMLLVFGGFFVFAEDMIADANNDVVAYAASQLAKEIEEEILITQQVREGYSREFTIPLSVAERNVQVQLLDSKELIVSTEQTEYITFLPFAVTIDLGSGPGSDGFLGMSNRIEKTASGVNIIVQ